MNLPVVGMPDWRGLTHWRGIVWDPVIIGVPRLRLCCDCLCLIALFRDVLLFVHDQTDSSARCLQDIGVWRTMRWELGSLGRDDPSCVAALSCCLDVWQIKGQVTIIEPRWANDILSLLCVSVCGTAVGVIAHVTAEILVISLSDRVGGSVGRSEWLLLVSWGAWLWCRQISARGVAVICSCAVRIGYKRRALAESSSIDVAPVTGSLLFYAPVCCLAVCRAAGFSSWELFGGSDSIWLAVFGLFYQRVSVICVMTTDSDAAMGGSAWHHV